MLQRHDSRTRETDDRLPLPMTGVLTRRGLQRLRLFNREKPWRGNDEALTWCVSTEKEFDDDALNIWDRQRLVESVVDDEMSRVRKADSYFLRLKYGRLSV